MVNRNKMRDKFKDLGLGYSDLTMKNICSLRDEIKMELSFFNCDMFHMELLDFNVNYSESGDLLRCFFKVKGVIENKYVAFEDREAISFNSDGFIGFAGWADKNNVQPFLKAFNKWVINLNKKA